MLVGQAVLLVLVVGSAPFDPNTASDGIILALDAAWPLSMLWLIVLGVRVARARLWPGALRWTPLIASLWFPVSILALGAGEWPGLVMSSLWLAGTYLPMGLLIAARADALPEPTTDSGQRVGGMARQG